MRIALPRPYNLNCIILTERSPPNVALLSQHMICRHSDRSLLLSFVFHSSSSLIRTCIQSSLQSFLVFTQPFFPFPCRPNLGIAIRGSEIKAQKPSPEKTGGDKVSSPHPHAFPRRRQCSWPPAPHLPGCLTCAPECSLFQWNFRTLEQWDKARCAFQGPSLLFAHLGWNADNWTPRCIPIRNRT